MDEAAQTRLRKICGLLGSDHDGERAAAAAKATALLREAGKTWADIGVGATSGMRGDLAAAKASEALWRRLLEDERSRTTSLSNQLLEARREIDRLNGKPGAVASPVRPKARRVDPEMDDLRRTVADVLDEVDAGELPLGRRTVDFLRSLHGRSAWTENQIDALRRTLGWVNKGRRNAA